MPDKWPSLYEQINAVLGAPIPFFLAVVAVAVIVWRGGEWLYRSVLNKRKELYELSRNEVDHWKTNAELTAKELREQIASLEDVNAERQSQLDRLTARLGAELGRLGQANSSVGILTPTLGPDYRGGGVATPHPESFEQGGIPNKDDL